MLSTVMIGASSGGTLLSRLDLRAGGRPRPSTWSGLIMAGVVPGLLFLVFRMCVRVAALCVASPLWHGRCAAFRSTGRSIAGEVWYDHSLPVGRPFLAFPSERQINLNVPLTDLRLNETPGF